MDVSVELFAMAGVNLVTWGTIWYKLGSIEQALKDLPCQGEIKNCEKLGGIFRGQRSKKSAV